MKTQRVAIALTVINLFLLVFLLSQFGHVSADSVVPVLRARALEIVDAQGRTRAEILVHGPETVNSKTYPETVLFRLSEPKSGPVVKLTASKDGAALGLSDGSQNGAVQLFASDDRGNLVRVANKNGQEQTIRP
jgi:hypothetical protein